MLSSALMTTHDGIVGYWDGAPLRRPAPLGTTDADTKYLSSEVRANLLDSMIFPDFTVTGADGQASLAAKGQSLVRVERPVREVFQQQLKMVRAYADLREDRMDEILEQTEDLVSFFGALGYLSADRHAKTMALLYTVLRVAVHVEMPIKHFCRAPRPIDYATHVQPMIQTPDHSSYPSGHAIEVFAAATVLARVMTGLGPKASLTDALDKGRMASMAFRLAHRVATNRSVAGVHFPVDSAAGAAIGCVVGEALYRIAAGNDDWPDEQVVSFAPATDGTPSFDLTLGWLRDGLGDDAASDLMPDEATILGKLWKEAVAEWAEFEP